MSTNKWLLTIVILISALFLSCTSQGEIKEVSKGEEGVFSWKIEAPKKNSWVSYKIEKILIEDGEEVEVPGSSWNHYYEPRKDKMIVVADPTTFESVQKQTGLYYVSTTSEYYVVYVNDIEDWATDTEAKSVLKNCTLITSYSSTLNLSLVQLWRSTGINGFIQSADELNKYNNDAIDSYHHDKEVAVKKQYSHSTVGGWGNGVMILVGLLLLYLAIGKGFEPLLLVPIGFGAILANIPFAGISRVDGFIGILYGSMVETGLAPILIFMGVGAMTDFGPLIANPRTLLLGAAAQLGIFLALIMAIIIGVISVKMGASEPLFDLFDAASIGIIGGADGPTAIYVTRKLSPDLLGAIAVAAYSYMALVPIIQPPIMRAMTTKKERAIKMNQLRSVSQLEKIVFPLSVLVVCILLLPDATPLIGALMLGNLAKESGCVDRLSDTMQNALMNIVTIFLGLSVGSKMAADKFLNVQTLGILFLGLIAFSFGTFGGVILAKIMNKFSKDPINPLIGSAGVSAVPMAARVSNNVGLESNKNNFLLMHAMGPNVAGVIGSAVAAGVLLNLVPFLAG